MRNLSKFILGLGVVIGSVSYGACGSRETPAKTVSTPPPAKQATVPPTPLPNAQTNTVSSPSPTKRATSTEPKNVRTEKKEAESISYATHPELFSAVAPAAPQELPITDPKTAQEHFNVAVYYDNVRQWEKAIPEYQRALEIKPDWALAHFRVAKDYRRLGRTDDAISHWEKTTQYDPQYYDAYYLLGLAYVNRGKDQQAIQAYSRLLEYPPATIIANYQLGVLYQHLGDKQKAREHLVHYRDLALKNAKETESPRFQKALRELKELKQ